MDSKIIVCMTSWVKRIKNVKPVVENIMQGTLQPDRLYLSLSVEEFPKKELDLPKDLVKYFNTNEKLILNWVDGENTKCMKKVFRFIATVIVVTIVVIGLNLLIEGVPLLGTPDVANVSSVIVEHSDFPDDIKKHTDDT